MKWRKIVPSATPARRAISLVAAPRKPRSAITSIAARNTRSAPRGGSVSSSGADTSPSMGE